MTRDDTAYGKLAESLIWPAIDLVGLVKGGGDRETIGELLTGLTDEQRWALPVILAAMVDDTKTPDELLSWVTFTEYGKPMRVPRTVTPRWRVAVVPCGSQEALRRHDQLGEECAECEAANVAWMQRRAATNSRVARREKAAARKREAA